MNERIKQLAKQVWPDPNTSHDNHMKFAELIVRECIHIALNDALPDWGNDTSVANAQCIKIATDLRQHFGVEE